jgi:hypothetical protein
MQVIFDLLPIKLICCQWPKSQHSLTQWRGGRWSSVEFSTRNKNPKNPPVKKTVKNSCACVWNSIKCSFGWYHTPSDVKNWQHRFVRHPLNILLGSVPDPWHVGTDPDPRPIEYLNLHTLTKQVGKLESRHWWWWHLFLCAY